jgi:hypothetical protein
MDYPASLIQRIQSDTDDALDKLAQPEPPSLSVPTIRELSHRKLLAATPEAIDTITSVMRTGSKKDRLEAGKVILAKSPATEETMTIGGESLPSEILKPLMDVFAGFAKAALSNLPPAPIPEAPEASYSIIKENSSVAPKRKRAKKEE